MHKNQTATPVAVLTAEQLLAYRPQQAKQIELEIPDLGGKVVARLLGSAAEWDDLWRQVHEEARDTRDYPLEDGADAMRVKLSGYPKLLLHYVWLSYCLISPKLTIPQLVQIGHRTGNLLVELSTEIQNANYATVPVIKRITEELKTDPTEAPSPG